MADSNLKHIVAYAYQAWSHARPLAILVARLVKLQPVQVTFLVHDQLYKRINDELARNFEAGEEDYAKRIRVYTVGPADFLTSPEAEENFKKTWGELVAEQPTACVLNKEHFDPFQKPHAIIIDMFAVGTFKTIKTISGDSVKIYMWHSSLTYEMFWFWGPEKLGGRGNYRLKAEEEARITGKPYTDIVLKMALGMNDSVVRIPAFPPMYDYEYYPQEPEAHAGILTNVVPYVYETFEGSDGVILHSSPSFEPEAIAAVKAWYAENNRPAYAVGPLLPTGSQVLKEASSSPDAEKIQALLDATLKTSGKHSLLYISFGTIFFPNKHPEQLWAVLDVAIELGIPFILSRASRAAVVPDDIEEKVKAYGKGIITAWAPQQTIFSHPATGWFITHGGQNGVSEAVYAGVPQIFWPFIGDQPLNAIHMTDTLQVAYELLEVRTGPGLRKILRNGKTPVGTIDALKVEIRDVLEKAFGEDGAQKRERLLALRERVVGDWAEGGASLKDATALLESL